MSSTSDYVWKTHKVQCDPALKHFVLPALDPREIKTLTWLDKEAGGDDYDDDHDSDGEPRPPPERKAWGEYPYKEKLPTLIAVDVNNGLCQGPFHIFLSRLTPKSLVPEPPFPTTHMLLLYRYFLETARRREPRNPRFMPPSNWLSLSRSLFPLLATMPNKEEALTVPPPSKGEGEGGGGEERMHRLALARDFCDALLVFHTLF